MKAARSVKKKKRIGLFPVFYSGVIHTNLVLIAGDCPEREAKQ
jgi:hypothetical protein